MNIQFEDTAAESSASKSDSALNTSFDTTGLKHACGGRSTKGFENHPSPVLDLEIQSKSKDILAHLPSPSTFVDGWLSRGALYFKCFGCCVIFVAHFKTGCCCINTQTDEVDVSK